MSESHVSRAKQSLVRLSFYRTDRKASLEGRPLRLWIVQAVLIFGWTWGGGRNLIASVFFKRTVRRQWPSSCSRPLYMINCLILGTWGGGWDHMASIEADGAKTVTMWYLVNWLILGTWGAEDRTTWPLLRPRALRLWPACCRRPCYLISWLILGTWSGGPDHMASIEADGAKSVTYKLPKAMVFDW